MWTPALAALLFLAQSTDFNQQGLKALDDNHYDQAIALFTQAVAADASDYGAHFNLAVAYSLAGRDAQAITEYRRALELKPGIFQAELNLGRSLFNTQQFTDAAEAYTRALALAKANSPANSGAPAELGLGRSLVRANRPADALPHYRQAAVLDPSSREYLLELAQAFEDQHLDVEALALYREFQQNPSAQEHVATLLLRTGQLDQSIAALEAVVATSPTAANRIALAQAYTRNHQPAKAEPLAALALAAAPNDYELRMFYGRLLRDQRKLPQAAEQFLACAKFKPDSIEAWTELAGMLVLTEQFPQAIAALDRVRGLGGETTGHYFLRALTLERLQQRKEALENYTKFLAGSQGKNPDQEFQARQRVRILEKALGKH